MLVRMELMAVRTATTLKHKMQSYESGLDKSLSERSFAIGHPIYIILLWLERIQPRIQPILSMVLRVSNQLIPLAPSQDQDKATPQNKCDASHHQNILMVIMKVPYTTW
jgi:hypothetical protein